MRICWVCVLLALQALEHEKKADIPVFDSKAGRRVYWEDCKLRQEIKMLDEFQIFVLFCP